MDITGWGFWQRNDEGRPIYVTSSVLRTVKQECLQPDECDIPDFDNEVQICVGDRVNPEHSGCNGDSGGILYCVENKKHCLLI